MNRGESSPTVIEGSRAAHAMRNDAVADDATGENENVLIAYR